MDIKIQSIDISYNNLYKDYKLRCKFLQRYDENYPYSLREEYYYKCPKEVKTEVKKLLNSFYNYNSKR